MNSFSIYQPISVLETSEPTPYLPVITINPLPPSPGIPSNFTPPKLVVSQSSPFMI